VAHIQQKRFCLTVKAKFPDYFRQKLILDIGSLDINGNNQYLLDSCGYIGVDLAEGRNVDIISSGHSLNLPDNTFDTIISTECAEHDQHYKETLRNIVRMLKPGGLFLFTCATTGRPEHGTRRTSPQDAPLLSELGDWADYYKNITEDDFREAIDVDSNFSSYEFSIGHETHDLYFWGIKRGNFTLRKDYSFQINDQAAHELDIRANNLKTTIIRSKIMSQDSRIILIETNKKRTPLIGSFAKIHAQTPREDHQRTDTKNDQ